jgi:hypothetical protein
MSTPREETRYPNREHQVADQGARRRALAALMELDGASAILFRRLTDGQVPYGSDAARLQSSLTKLTVSLAALEALRDVREWDAADQAPVQK